MARLTPVLLCTQVQEHVADAKAKGATIAIGGESAALQAPYDKGFFHPVLSQLSILFLLN